ncbi:MAG: hypothetical protein NC388_00530 [Clostridium sp.]|nr:hypothetical protein [Clostridium sp.]
MKKRLLSMAALLAAGVWTGMVSAQTDVTSQYFTNPSFENGTEGWTLPTADSFYNNGTYKSEDAVPSALGTKSTPSDGEHFFHTRHGWNNKSGQAWNTSTSSSQELPAGKYYLVVDYKAYDMCNDGAYHSQLNIAVTKEDGTSVAASPKKQLFAYFSDNTNNNDYIAKADWSKLGVYFELTEATKINVGLNADLWSNQRSDILYDNLRLYTCADVTVNAPLDMTGSLPNARMEAGALVWEGGLAAQGNTNYPNFSGFYMLEKWTGAPNTLANLDAKQTLTGLPNGRYRLTATINATQQGKKTDKEDKSDEIEGVTLYAGSASMAVATKTGNPQSFSVEEVVANGTMQVGVKVENTSANWISLDNFSLTYLGFDTSAAVAKLNEMLVEARALAEANESLASLLADLNNKIANAENALQVATASALESASSELSAAMEAYKAGILPLSQLKGAIAYNRSVLENSEAVSADVNVYRVAIEDAQNAVNTASSLEEVTNAVSALELARQTYVMGAYPTNGTTFDMTFRIVNAAVTSTNGWTVSNVGINNNVDYEGAPDIYAFDKWNGSAMTVSAKQDLIDLAPGVYTLTAMARTNGNNSLYIYATAGGNEMKSMIPNDGLWTLITVENIAVSVDGKMTVGMAGNLNNTWVSADNFRLTLVRDFTPEEKAQAYIDQLNATIAQAKAINTTVNVGDAAFQHSAASVEALLAAIATAEAVSTTDIPTLEAANSDLKAAMEAYELNAPAEGQVFNVIIRTNDGYKFKDIPVAFREDGKAGMFFEPTYVNKPHMAQYVTFTKVDGADNYVLGTLFADGVERYMSTGVTSGNGSNAAQIRLTDDKEKALVTKVIATETEGIYRLWNTEANDYIGCQDGDSNAQGGFYTTGSHSDLALVAVEKPEVTLNVTEAGFATVMLPYAVKEIPEGIKVYTTEAAEESSVAGNRVLTLVEADEMAANTPYIVEGKAGEYKFTGIGAAYADAYTNGLLTGTFVGMTAQAGTYVLQTNNGITGFYCVAEGAEPAIGANRAYLTAPAGEAEVTAFVFSDLQTGIHGVEAADVRVDVYTIDGVRVRQGVKMSDALNGLNKGVYVVNGAKKAVK